MFPNLSLESSKKRKKAPVAYTATSHIASYCSYFNWFQSTNDFLSYT